MFLRSSLTRFCGVAGNIVLLGGHCHWRVLLVGDGLCGLHQVCFKCYWHEGQDAEFPRKTLHCNKMVTVEHWITGQCGWWVYSYHFTAQVYISCSVHFYTRLWSVWSNEYSPYEPDAVGAAGAASPRVRDSGLKYYCLVVIKFSFKKWTVQRPKHCLVTLYLIEIFVV